MALGLHLVLIQQKPAISRGKVRRRTSGDLPTGSAACSSAPRDRCQALVPGLQCLVEEGSFQGLLGACGPVPFGVGITGNTNNSLVGLMDYQAVSWQRGLGGKLVADCCP